MAKKIELDNKDIGYIRMYIGDVGYQEFKNYCDMPNANISEEDGGHSVYFYTINKNLVPEEGLLE